MKLIEFSGKKHAERGNYFVFPTYTGQFNELVESYDYLSAAYVCSDDLYDLFHIPKRVRCIDIVVYTEPGPNRCGIRQDRLLGHKSTGWHRVDGRKKYLQSETAIVFAKILSKFKADIKNDRIYFEVLYNRRAK